VDLTRPTRLGRALGRLGIEHIPRSSPQARGRSERLNRTLQGRLINELRVAGLTTVAAANASLHDQFIPDYNTWFTSRPSPSVTKLLSRCVRLTSRRRQPTVHAIFSQRSTAGSHP